MTWPSGVLTSVTGEPADAEMTAKVPAINVIAAANRLLELYYQAGGLIAVPTTVPAVTIPATSGNDDTTAKEHGQEKTCDRHETAKGA